MTSLKISDEKPQDQEIEMRKNSEQRRSKGEEGVKTINDTD